MFTSSALVNAQEIQQSKIKTPFPVHGLCWSKDNTKFLYTEQQNIVLRNSISFSVEKVISASEADVSFAVFAPSAFIGYERLIAASEDGNIYYWILPGDPKPDIFPVQKDDDQTSKIVFDRTGAYAAYGLNTGEVVLLRQHQLLRSTFTRHSFYNDQNRIYSLCFSNNGEYLVAGSEDGKFTVWNVLNMTVAKTSKFYAKDHVPVCFTKKSDAVIFCSDKKTIEIQSVRDEFEKPVKIKLNQNVVSLKISEKNNHLVVLTDWNQLLFFDVSTGKQIGYIPSYNVNQISDYCFNSDDSKVLVGHVSGDIYVFTVKEVFLKPGDLPPSLKVLSSSELGGGSGSGASFGAMPLRILTIRKGHFIDFRINGVYAPDPFNWNIDFDVGYINSDLNKGNLYAGVLAGAQIGLPNKNFPYRYRVKNEVQKDPYLLCGKITVPVGLCLMPFDKDIYILTEFDAGISYYGVWNGSSDSYVLSNGGLSALIGATLGIGYKPFVFHIGGRYDFCQGFLVSSGVGLNFKVKGGRV